MKKRSMMSLVASTQSSSVMASMVTLPLSLEVSLRGGRTADLGTTGGVLGRRGGQRALRSLLLGVDDGHRALTEVQRKLGRAGAAC